MGGIGGNNIYTNWYVAKNKDNKIVGCVRYAVYDFDFEKQQVMLELSLLAVDSDYQSKGVGTKLVQTSLKRLRKKWQKNGFRPIMIFLEADEVNGPARKFYEKVFKNPKSVLLENLWGKDSGAVFYFKRFT
jgi:ribosomal protein S18 acetylase RimI-like enzyme